MQTYDKYDVRYTHEKYKANDNYNCTYKNHGKYNYKRYKEREKSRTAVQVGSLSQTNERERNVCKERRKGDFVWPTGKMKSLPYEQVTSTIKTNVAAIQ